tara:strand:- start:30 stop:491 length:462 start_codon:yes stop_codon:yes gene_type:complete
MTSYAVVKRYEQSGEQSKGFIKLLQSLQNFESALEEFETYVELGWRKCLEEIDKMQPTTWEKIKGVDMRQKFLLENPDGFAFYILDDMVRDKSYKGRLDGWKQFEKKVGVDVANWYTRYSHLRNLIRVGLEYSLDAPMAKFVNVWNNRCSCFR